MAQYNDMSLWRYGCQLKNTFHPLQIPPGAMRYNCSDKMLTRLCLCRNSHYQQSDMMCLQHLWLLYMYLRNMIYMCFGLFGLGMFHHNSYCMMCVV